MAWKIASRTPSRLPVNRPSVTRTRARFPVSRSRTSRPASTASQIGDGPKRSSSGTASTERADAITVEQKIGADAAPRCSCRATPRIRQRSAEGPRARSHASIADCSPGTADPGPSVPSMLALVTSSNSTTVAGDGTAENDSIARERPSLPIWKSCAVRSVTAQAVGVGDERLHRHASHLGGRRRRQQRDESDGRHGAKRGHRGMLARYVLRAFALKPEGRRRTSSLWDVPSSEAGTKPKRYW